MNREEAARILDPITSQQAIDELSCGGTNAKKLIVDLACRMGAEALRNPWVKTSDRLPDKCDETKYLIARQRICGEWHTLQVTGLYIKKNPTRCPWWMPIPLLPEVPND